MAANRWTMAVGVLAVTALAGCEATPGGDAAAVRPDVTDIRPAPKAATADASTGGPAVYDMSGLIPTAPQPLTEPAAVPAAAVVPPSTVMFTPPARPSPVHGRTHIVTRGETLFAIARAQYGDGRQWKRLAAANPAAAGGLRVGQQIVLP